MDSTGNDRNGNEMLTVTMQIVDSTNSSMGYTNSLKTQLAQQLNQDSIGGGSAENFLPGSAPEVVEIFEQVSKERPKTSQL